MPGRDAQQGAMLEAALRDVFERRIAFNELLGFRIELLPDAPVRVHFDMRPELVGHFLHGRLHGGVTAAVLDVAGGLSVMWSIAARHPDASAAAVLELFAPIGTVDLRVDYLRQGLGEHFTAEAETVRLGRRIAAVSMHLRNQDDTMIATGNGTYMVS